MLSQAVTLFHLSFTIEIFFLGDGSCSNQDAAASSLFITLKDHKEQDPMTLLALNKTRCVRGAVAEQGFDMDHVSI